MPSSVYTALCGPSLPRGSLSSNYVLHPATRLLCFQFLQQLGLMQRAGQERLHEASVPWHPTHVTQRELCRSSPSPRGLAALAALNGTPWCGSLPTLLYSRLFSKTWPCWLLPEGRHSEHDLPHLTDESPRPYSTLAAELRMTPRTPDGHTHVLTSFFPFYLCSHLAHPSQLRARWALGPS